MRSDIHINKNAPFTFRGLSRGVGHHWQRLFSSVGTPHDLADRNPTFASTNNKDSLRPSDPLRISMTRPPLSCFPPHIVTNTSALSASLPLFPCQSGSARPTTTDPNAATFAKQPALLVRQPCHQAIPRVLLPYTSQGR